MSECSSSCSSCEQSSSCSSSKGKAIPQDMRIPPNEKSSIKKVIAVMSGKGGVGKSLVTASLATAMAKRGKKVGVLDADITGPSIPNAFGIHTHADASEDGILPTITKSGVKIISLNLLTANETDPVIWRGPVIAGVAKQFWTDVVWGDLDYLFLDMPPGTGDIPLTMFQSLPVDGIVMVTSPQELVSMIVTKAINMARTMGVPMIGLVENYSYFECPSCNEKHAIFGESRLESVAKQFALPVLGRIPIDPKLADYCDRGEIETVEPNYLEPVATAILELENDA